MGGAARPGRRCRTRVGAVGRALGDLDDRHRARRAAAEAGLVRGADRGPHRVGRPLDRRAERADLGAQPARPDRRDGRVDVGVAGVVGAGRAWAGTGSRRSRLVLQVSRWRRVGRRAARPPRSVTTASVSSSSLLMPRVDPGFEHLVAQRVREALGAHGAGRAAHRQQRQQRADGPGELGTSVAHHRDPGPARPGDDVDRREPRRGQQQPVGEVVVVPPAVPAEHDDRGRVRAPPRAGARARGRCGPWPPGGARRCRRPTVTASIDGAATESRSPTSSSTPRPSARAWSAPESAATTGAPAGTTARRRGSIGSPPATTTTVVGRSGDVGTAHRFPPLALPRSGSRVGDAALRRGHPLSPAAPSSPCGSTIDATAPRVVSACVCLQNVETNAHAETGLDPLGPVRAEVADRFRRISPAVTSRRTSPSG